MPRAAKIKFRWNGGQLCRRFIGFPDVGDPGCDLFFELFANTDWLQRTVSFHDLRQHETLEFNAEARFEKHKERYVRIVLI
jgi:hypothetical protein